MIEKDLLSAAMLNQENVLVALESGVIPEWFEKPKHKVIFAELMEISGKRMWTERDSMVCLQAEGLFDRHHDALELCSHTPDWAFSIEEFKNAIDVLRSAHAQRKLLEATTMAMHSLDAGQDPFDVGDSLKREIETVNEASPSESMTIRDIATEAYNNDERVSKGECVGLPFPWESFQRRTFGIPLKAVTPLPGRDGKGKSRLATYLAHYWLSCGHAGIYFPFEDSAQRFMSNLAATHGQYDMFTIRRGYPPPKFMETHARCLDEVSKYPLVVSDAPTCVERLVSKIANAKRSHDIKFAVVDGIKDIITPSAESQTVAENRMVAALVRAAKEYNIALIPVTHLTDIEDDKWISKRFMRGSKVQSQSARMVLVFQDAGFPPGVAKYPVLEGDVMLDCQKSSYGDRGIIHLRPELTKGRFLEVGYEEPRERADLV